MKTDALWMISFLLGFIFAFAVINTTPGIGLFIGVNTLVAALLYFGSKNQHAKELEHTAQSEILLKVLTACYVVLTIPYLYRLDFAVVGTLVAFHLAFLIMGALYFALPSALHIVDLLSLILSPITLALTWFIESIKSFFELFKDNANTVKLLLKIVLYAAASLLVFIMFAKLLSAADAEFKVRIDKILESLDLIIVMQRIVIGVIASFISAGLLTVVGLTKALPLFGITQEKAKSSWEKAFTFVMSKRSDAILPVIITTPVLFLFGLYVWVQFAYLFGQDVASILAKYSFADYARRGFIELLVVGALTYPLLSWSMHQSKSEWKIPRIATFVINTGIVSMLVIMLYSLVMRMNLYMNTYGPSVLRMYVIVGAVFVGVALVAYELLAVAKALKPGFTVFKGRILTDYVIVAILVSIGLLGAISLVPWNNIVGKKIVSYYENSRKIDIFQIIKLPLESENLVYQLGKTLEADGLKEAGYLLQAHAIQEVSLYKTSREDSIFSKVFGFNVTGAVLLNNVNSINKEAAVKKFTTAMNERIAAVDDGYLDALQVGDFALARTYYDPEMKANDITGLSTGVSVVRSYTAQTMQEKVSRESYVESFISGTSTSSTYDAMIINRGVGQNYSETTISSTLGFRNGKVVILDSTLILAYLPDAVSSLGDRYDVSAYGYRTYCQVPTLDVIYSESLGCSNGYNPGLTKPALTTPVDSSTYLPMGSFLKSDFVTERQQ